MELQQTVIAEQDLLQVSPCLHISSCCVCNSMFADTFMLSLLKNDCMQMLWDKIQSHFFSKKKVDWSTPLLLHTNQLVLCTLTAELICHMQGVYISRLHSDYNHSHSPHNSM